jgi:hypothetical protein
MNVSNAGTWLLTVEQDWPQSPYTVRVWDVNAGQLCWELTASQARAPESTPTPQLRDCRGLTEVERAYWQSYDVDL